MPKASLHRKCPSIDDPLTFELWVLTNIHICVSNRDPAKSAEAKKELRRLRPEIKRLLKRPIHPTTAARFRTYSETLEEGFS